MKGSRVGRILFSSGRPIFRKVSWRIYALHFPFLYSLSITVRNRVTCSRKRHRSRLIKFPRPHLDQSFIAHINSKTKCICYSPNCNVYNEGYIFNNNEEIYTPGKRKREYTNEQFRAGLARRHFFSQ